MPMDQKGQYCKGANHPQADLQVDKITIKISTEQCLHVYECGAQVCVCVWVDKHILKFIRKCNIAKKILKKNARGLAVPESKSSYKDTETKIVWYWCKNKQIDQWNRSESP